MLVTRFWQHNNQLAHVDIKVYAHIILLSGVHTLMYISFPATSIVVDIPFW